MTRSATLKQEQKKEIDSYTSSTMEVEMAGDSNDHHDNGDHEDDDNHKEDNQGQEEEEEVDGEDFGDEEEE